jgi:hypothetical protein
MPETTKAPSELDSLAFEIYKAGVASSNRPGEAWAIESYRKAEMFLAVRSKIQNGTVKAAIPEGPQLAEVCAPNLPKTHPINLVSQRFGDLKKVNRIQAYLANNKASPNSEDSELELLERVRREFVECEKWGKEELSTARVVFPAYTKMTISSQ